MKSRRSGKPVVDKGWLNDLLVIASVYLAGTAGVLAALMVA